MNRYLISDLHLGHKNIIKYEKRPFKNVEEMDSTLINNWNQTVNKREIVFCLGDFSFHKKDKNKSIINNLNGYKILIMGNHDRHNTRKYWLDCGFNEVIKYPIIIDEFYMLSHEPLYISENMPYVNIHGHIHSKCYDNKQYVNVSVENIGYKPILFNNIKKNFIQERENMNDIL